MPDTKRLVSKLDDAVRIVRKQRRGPSDGEKLAEMLRPRFAAGRPFDMTIGHVATTVVPEHVRISKTTLSMGRLEFSLLAVSTCQHGVDGDGDPIHGLALHHDDGSIVPIRIG